MSSSILMSRRTKSVSIVHNNNDKCSNCELLKNEIAHLKKYLLPPQTFSPNQTTKICIICKQQCHIGQNETMCKSCFVIENLKHDGHESIYGLSACRF